MKIILKILFFIFFISNSVYSQNSYNKIIGSWLYKGIENKDFIECPDFLTFKNDSSYIIFNDCYGNNPESPIIEKGIWSFHFKENTILLKNRKYFINYIFQNDSSKVLTLFIKEISEKTMKICFSNKDNCIVEQYVKKNN